MMYFLAAIPQVRRRLLMDEVLGLPGPRKEGVFGCGIPLVAQMLDILLCASFGQCIEP